MSLAQQDILGCQCTVCYLDGLQRNINILTENIFTQKAHLDAVSLKITQTVTECDTIAKQIKDVVIETNPSAKQESTFKHELEMKLIKLFVRKRHLIVKRKSLADSLAETNKELNELLFQKAHVQECHLKRDSVGDVSEDNSEVLESEVDQWHQWQPLKS